MSIIAEVVGTVRTLVGGLAHTMARIPQPKTTVSYPDDPVQLSARFRGEHFLDVDENGKEKCVACFLCSAICPADAIYIEGADDPRPYPERVGVETRYPTVYRIDYGRCILCGFCVEACPKDAIKHGHNFEMASYTREGLIRDKDELLANRTRQRSLNITIRT
jgi:NADH-quinone oxidoreductase subunit I